MCDGGIIIVLAQTYRRCFAAPPSVVACHESVDYGDYNVRYEGSYDGHRQPLEQQFPWPTEVKVCGYVWLFRSSIVVLLR